MAKTNTVKHFIPQEKRPTEERDLAFIDYIRDIEKAESKEEYLNVRKANPTMPIMGSHEMWFVVNCIEPCLSAEGCVKLKKEVDLATKKVARFEKEFAIERQNPKAVEFWNKQQ